MLLPVSVDEAGSAPHAKGTSHEATAPSTPEAAALGSANTNSADKHVHTTTANATASGGCLTLAVAFLHVAKGVGMHGKLASAW